MSRSTQPWKESVKRMIRSAVGVASRTNAGRFLQRQLIESAMNEVRMVNYKGLSLRFVAPNALCAWRAETFATKEPETLDWIDALPEGGVHWDVGANVGLYAVYAAARRNLRIWAFEPSVFNLELLARNVHLNGVSDRVCLVPLALSDQAQMSEMRLTTTEWGGALSTFGEQFGWDGQAIKQVFAYRTVGVSITDAVERLGVPSPSSIKMDVDGLEHFILRGGGRVLAEVETVLIEVNDDFTEQAQQCQALLTQAGLRLKDKQHSVLIAASQGGFDQSYNQIWVRG